MERYGSSALATSSASRSTLPSTVLRSPVPAWQSADFSALAQPMVNLSVAFWRHAGSTATPFAAAFMWHVRRDDAFLPATVSFLEVHVLGPGAFTRSVTTSSRKALTLAATAFASPVGARQSPAASALPHPSLNFASALATHSGSSAIPLPTALAWHFVAASALVPATESFFDVHLLRRAGSVVVVVVGGAVVEVVVVEAVVTRAVTIAIVPSANSSFSTLSPRRLTPPTRKSTIERTSLPSPARSTTSLVRSTVCSRPSGSDRKRPRVSGRTNPLIRV